MTTEQKRTPWRRWFLLGLMVLGGVLALGVRGVFTPISPVVILPAEPFMPYSVTEIAPGISVGFTNTMASLALAIVFLLWLALGVVQPFVRQNTLVPTSKLYQLVEMLIEFYWNTTQSAAGKYAKRIFPFVMTIFLLVFSANFVKLIPIHETIGYTKVAHGTITGYDTVAVGPFLLLNGDAKTTPAMRAEAHGADHSAEGDKTKSKYNCTKDCEVVPMFRGAATDLNFTFALSLVTMVMVQVFGVQALGLSYFTKFINLRTIIQKPFFGLMDFVVGLLELISEFAKVLSFGLRLFGTIFAGTLLLGILGVLLPVFIPGFIFGLETFVGILQAYVFSVLALTFMSQATVSHHGDDHAEAH